MASWDSRFAGQLCADDLVVVAASAADIQTGFWPPKSAAMIFGPRRKRIWEWCSLPPVLGSSRPARGEPRQPKVCTMRLLVPCTWHHPSSWCTSCPAMLGARNSLPHHPLPSGVWIVRCASGVGSCWVGPLVSPSVGVLVELGWPDAERISSGRLQSQFGRVTSMINGPIPVAVFQAASRMPGTWTNCALNMCHSLGAPLPDACGVISGSPPSVSRRWFESEVRHLLDDGLHNRAAVGIASLSVIHFPPSAFSVGGGPDPTVYGRGSSPDHARAWGLARWAFCHAPVGDLVHCLSECPWFEDLRTEWCGIPVQAASVWSRHSWIFDTTSLLNSPGTLRAHVRSVGAVCRRFSEPVP